MRINHSGNYDDVRCRCCGCAWEPGVNERTGEIEAGHPDNLWCSRYRPIAPAWVAEALARHERARDAVCATASNLKASIDDAEKARREVAGGVPTREWPTDDGRVERSGYVRVLGGEDARNGAPNGEV